jgi:shikimate 5-dehydrogenase
MIKYGIIGWPLKKSKSPEIMNNWLIINKIPYRYILIPVDPSKFNTNIKILKKNLYGFNVTMPYKQKVIPYMDKLDKEAENTGAVNCCVWNKETGWTGYNTDWKGIRDDFKRLGIQTKNKKIMVIGTGGTARAIKYAFPQSVLFNSRQKINSEGYDIIIKATPPGHKLDFPVTYDIDPFKQGYGMLIRQAAYNFELFTGIKPYLPH